MPSYDLNTTKEPLKESPVLLIDTEEKTRKLKYISETVDVHKFQADIAKDTVQTASPRKEDPISTNAHQASKKGKKKELKKEKKDEKR